MFHQRRLPFANYLQLQWHWSTRSWCKDKSRNDEQDFIIQYHCFDCWLLYGLDINVLMSTWIIKRDFYVKAVTGNLSWLTKRWLLRSTKNHHTQAAHPSASFTYKVRWDYVYKISVKMFNFRIFFKKKIFSIQIWYLSMLLDIKIDDIKVHIVTTLIHWLGKL